jgi:pimeloyl-ACP methyl ester carboxylesterase
VASTLRAIGVIAVMTAATMLSAQLGLHLQAWHAARRSRRCPDEACRPATLRAWQVARETALALIVFALWPAAAAAPPRDRRVIVLLHGLGSSPVSLWLLAARLRRAGWAVSVPRLGGRWHTLAEAAERVALHLDSLRETRGTGDVVLVAHGVAGLAARLLIARRGRRLGVRQLITLGTPHRGTLSRCPLARGPLAREIRPGSDVLAELARVPLPAGVEAMAIASPDDALLVPAENAYWPEACNVSVEGSGHLHLLVSARVCEIVAENLPRPGPAMRRHGS